MTYNPTVLRYKSAYMQRLCDYVRLGYVFWTRGEVRADRAHTLARKFDELYSVGKSRHQKAYAKHKGEANAVLLLYAPSSGERAPTSDSVAPAVASSGPTSALLQWTLLVTPGEHIAHKLEKLRDARTRLGRLALTGYELVQHSRPATDRPAWTWRMTKTTYEGWRLRLIGAARHGERGLAAEAERLTRVPGFAGCRVQGKKLQQLAAAELRRRYPDHAKLPWRRLRYLQRLPNEGLPLRTWISACDDLHRVERQSAS